MEQRFSIAVVGAAVTGIDLGLDSIKCEYEMTSHDFTMYLICLAVVHSFQWHMVLPAVEIIGWNLFLGLAYSSSYSSSSHDEGSSSHVFIPLFGMCRGCAIILHQKSHYRYSHVSVFKTRKAFSIFGL